MSLPTPPANVAVALASLAVHAQEALGPGGHSFDLVAMQGCLATEGLNEYLAELDALALLPERRDSV